ncbi:hypothetical protein SDC9_93830 [bioreactor metagenome]|uniref:Uncharacterized protein n=1 Tax=bioreactor metagenome TaxID=1076179 RepID=A0A645A263_9ZZZZ|nr:hypothetical protein [Oscillospiraceae bacterium]
MGFGLLLIGYMFLASFSVAFGTDSKMTFDIFPDIIAWSMMLLGLNKLSPYSDKLRLARYAAIFMIPVSLYTMLDNFRLFGFFGSFGQIINNIIGYVTVAVMLIYHYLLLFGIRDIALTCSGQKRFCDKLKFGFALTGVYYGVYLAVTIAGSFYPAVYGYGTPLVSLFGVAWIITNVLLIFEAFRKIILD